VAIAVGVIFLMLGFCPKLTAVLAIMPRAVVVSALLFTVTFIIINGVQVMTSRLLDSRRTLVLGLAIVAGGAVEVFPSITAATQANYRRLSGRLWFLQPSWRWRSTSCSESE
jgi:NCS2 family nucleobase:cation symporter-2